MARFALFRPLGGLLLLLIAFANVPRALATRTVTFASDPHWTKQSPDNLAIGYNASVPGEGGRFLRTQGFNWLADTDMPGPFLRTDTLGASGEISFRGATNFDGVLFIGHFNDNATGSRSTYSVGLRFFGNTNNSVRVQAFCRFDSGADLVTPFRVISAVDVHSFSYAWSPTGGVNQMGRLTCVVHDELLDSEVNDTVDADANFDGKTFTLNAFGIWSGLAASNAAGSCDMFLIQATYDVPALRPPAPIPTNLQITGLQKTNNFATNPGWVLEGSDGLTIGYNSTVHGEGGNFFRTPNFNFLGDTNIGGTFLRSDVVQGIGKLSIGGGTNFDGQFLLGHFNSNAVSSAPSVGLRFFGNSVNSLRVQAYCHFESGSDLTTPFRVISGNQAYTFAYKWDPQGGTNGLGSLVFWLDSSLFQTPFLDEVDATGLNTGQQFALNTFGFWSGFASPVNPNIFQVFLTAADYSTVPPRPAKIPPVEFTMTGGHKTNSFSSDPHWTLLAPDDIVLGYNAAAPGEGGNFYRTPNFNFLGDTNLGGNFLRTDIVQGVGRFTLGGGTNFDGQFLIGHFNSAAIDSPSAGSLGLRFFGNSANTMRVQGFCRFDSGTDLTTPFRVLAGNQTYYYAYKWDPTGGANGSGSLAVWIDGDVMQTPILDRAETTAQNVAQRFALNAFGIWSGLAPIVNTNTFLVYLNAADYSKAPARAPELPPVEYWLTGVERTNNFATDPGWTLRSPDNIQMGYDAVNHRITGLFPRSTNFNIFADTNLNGKLNRGDVVQGLGRFNGGGGTNFDGVFFLGHFNPDATDARTAYSVGLRFFGNSLNSLRVQAYCQFDSGPSLVTAFRGISGLDTFSFAYKWDPTGGTNHRGNLSVWLKDEAKDVETVDSIDATETYDARQFELKAFGIWAGLAGAPLTDVFRWSLDAVDYSVLSPQRELPSHVRVMILAGQSNARGKIPDPSPLGVLSARQPDVFFFDDGVWQGLKPPTETDCIFGSEIEWGRDLADQYGGGIAVIKLGVGGTTLAVDWDPQVSTSLYYTLLNKVRAGLQSLTAQGRTYELGGLIWVHGESDGATLSYTQAYPTNLVNFVAKLRGDLAAPNLPIITTRVPDFVTSDRSTYVSIMRQKQADAVAAISNSVLVNADGLTQIGDDLHLDSAGQLNLGARIAQAYYVMVPPTTPKRTPFLTVWEDQKLLISLDGTAAAVQSSGDLKIWQTQAEIPATNRAFFTYISTNPAAFFRVQKH